MIPLAARSDWPYVHDMDVKTVKFMMGEVGGHDVLAGAGTGRKVCAALLAGLAVPKEPTLCLLDFRGVSVATSSFLREAVLRFRDAARAGGSPVYAVVANANAEVAEELDDLLRARAEAMVACVAAAPGAEPSDPVLLGALEAKQRKTLDLLHAAGEADAASLQALDAEGEKVGHTAWNNRLAALASKGVVIEIQRGRAKRYRPLMPGV